MRLKKGKPATSKRSAKTEAKEQRERRNLATGISIATALAFGALFIARHRSTSQTGHFPISVSVLMLLTLMLLFSLYAVFDWYRHR